MVIHVNPNTIKNFSIVNGGGVAVARCLNKYGFEMVNKRVNGNWDSVFDEENKAGAYNDFDNFLNNKETIYDWQPLMDSIKSKGYVQNKDERYIEVAIGRKGELLLVDGRHRLIIAQHLGIKSIPVFVLYMHVEFDTVMPRFMHDELVSIWNVSVAALYQTYESIAERFGLSGQYMDAFKGRKVLDVGCNSFVSAYSIMKHAYSVVGIDNDKDWYELGKKTVKYLGINNVEIQHKSLLEFNGDVDALFLSFVLYWLSDQEIEHLKSVILPKCKVVMVVTRLKERSDHQNSYFLNRQEAVDALFLGEGFEQSKKQLVPAYRVDDHFEGGLSVSVYRKSSALSGIMVALLAFTAIATSFFAYLKLA